MAIDYNNVIRSVSYDQHSILKDIIDLHNNGNSFDVDLTYSIGAFYGTFKRIANNGIEEEYTIPRPKYTFDICPQDEYTQKIDAWGNIPLDDNSVNSVVVDLPFVIAPRDSASTKEDKEGRNITFKRFSSFYPVNELLSSYKHWLEESYRILKDDGILIWKCQNTITGGKFLCSEEWSWLCAIATGFEELDRFTLIAKARLHSGKIKTQQHARNFSSVFWVFKKSKKKSIPYLSCMNDDERGIFLKSIENHMILPIKK